MGLFWSRDSGFSGLGYVSNPWEWERDRRGLDGYELKVGTGRRK